MQKEDDDNSFMINNEINILKEIRLKKKEAQDEKNRKRVAKHLLMKYTKKD